MVDFYPSLQFLLLVFAGWVNRQQLEVIDYLKEENRILRETLGDDACALPSRWPGPVGCPHCHTAAPHGGGTLKIIAAIEDPHVIAKILTHLSLSARAPPRSPARPFDRLRMA